MKWNTLNPTCGKYALLMLLWMLYNLMLLLCNHWRRRKGGVGEENALTGFSRSKGAALILILYLYFWALFEPCDRWTRISLVILWMISLVYWCQASAKNLSTCLVYRSNNFKNEQARVFMLFSSQNSFKARGHGQGATIFGRVEQELLVFLVSLLVSKILIRIVLYLSPFQDPYF